MFGDFNDLMDNYDERIGFDDALASFDEDSDLEDEYYEDTLASGEYPAYADFYETDSWDFPETD